MTTNDQALSQEFERFHARIDDLKAAHANACGVDQEVIMAALKAVVLEAVAFLQHTGGWDKTEQPLATTH